MSKYTHLVIDNLGSFPAIGDAVLEVGLSGQRLMKRITAMSVISDRPPNLRWAYVTLVDPPDEQGKVQWMGDWYAYPQAISLDPVDT